MDSRLLILALGAFVGTLDNFVIAGLLPGISAEMGVSISQAGYLVVAYSISYAVGAPVLSTLFGGLGRRRVLAGAEMVLAVSALLLAFAPAFPLMIVERVILACGAGLFTSMAQATAVAISAPERRGRAVSVVLTGGTLAVALGAPIAAWVAATYGWRATYLLIGGMALITATTMWFLLPRGLQGETRSIRERLEILTVPGIPMALLVSMLYMAGIFVVATYLAPITTRAMSLGGEIIPLVLMANGIGSVVGGLIGGQLTDRFGLRRTALVVISATALILASISIIPGLPQPLVLPCWLLAMGALGMGGWSLFPAQLSRLALLAPNSIPLAISLNLSAVNLGAAIGALGGGWTLDHLGAGSLGWVSAISVIGSLGLAYATMHGAKRVPAAA